MTQHKIRTLPDGTRVYSNGTRYKPKAVEDRAYAVRKPDHPDAQRFGGLWFLPLPLLPLDERTMPPTRSDEEAYDHMPRPCKCDVCRRGPEVVGRWQRKWQRDRGLIPSSARSDPAAPRR